LGRGGSGKEDLEKRGLKNGGINNVSLGKERIGKVNLRIGLNDNPNDSPNDDPDDSPNEIMIIPSQGFKIMTETRIRTRISNA
jgi:hypothetical protein